MRFRSWSAVAAMFVAPLLGWVHAEPVQAFQEDVQWTSRKLSKLFHGEGGTLADLDADGHMDVVAGYMAFFGPDFQQSVALHPAKPYNINGYSEFFFAFDYDVDRDGDLDVVSIGFPGAAAHWYRNPGSAKARQSSWERFVILDVVDNESPTFADITGDGVPELLCINSGTYGYASIPADPTQKWTFRAVSAPGPYQRFTHGMGIGDVDDDGRMDMLAKEGWWRQPANDTGAAWEFHPVEFSGPGGAQMYAVDLDRDGKTEVVTSLAAHGYGLAIYKKTRVGEDYQWTRQDIMTDKVESSPTGLAVSQLHAIDIADMDSDGQLDIVTGKRFWAHNGNDAGENEPPMLVWFKPVVISGGLKFVPNIIDSDSGVGTQVLVRDANGDGRPDVLSVSKRGVHLLIQSPAPKDKPTQHPRDIEGSIATASIAIDDALGGFRPAWNAQETLNVDFEAGDLRDWTALGGAFFNQPIAGDAVAARRKDMASNHQGVYWIGSFEVGGDVAMGTMTSRPFRVTHPWISFLIAGGSSPNVGCEIVEFPSGTVLKTVRGADTETLRRAVIDATGWKGKDIQIRLIDRMREGWGHINFDDFRLHDAEPNIPIAERVPVVDVLQHQSLRPEQVAAAMTLPEGFTVQVAAHEPDVRQPIAMTLDHRNRLWVVESYTYPIRAEGSEVEGRDRILILEDADLDGKYEKQKVFAEKLNLVSGIEVGFGGVWVGAAPYLLFIPDRNGDDVPDSAPVRKLDGWGYQDTHETLNSFIWGPDGWLYGCHGVFTHSKVGVVGKDGASVGDDQRVPFNAGIWRYHPVHERFEVFAHGTSNPWGVDFDDVGEAFLTACVIPHLYHVIPNARYQRQAGNHFNRFTYEDIPTIALHRHWIGDTPHAGNNRSDAAGGGHAHSGAMIYLGGSWPERYRNQIFMNNIHGARLNQDQLARRGSGYVGDRAPDFLLANDRSSQILYFRYGPDGQVVAIDWYDAQQCHTTNPANHDASNGRIYRIAYEGAKPVAVDLSRASDLELAEHQTHRNDWYCRTARRLLSERAAEKGVSADALSKLRGMAMQGDVRVRLRAIWTLAACGELTDGELQRLLNDPSEDIASWAVRLTAPSSVASLALRGQSPKRKLTSASPALANAVAGLAKSASPKVRLALASWCQEVTPDQALPILKSLAGHAEDADDHNLPKMIWWGISKLLESEPKAFAELLSASKLDTVSRSMVRQMAEMALDADPAVAPQQLQALLVGVRAQSPEKRIGLLDEVLRGMEKRRTVSAPTDWPALRREWLGQANEELRNRALLLAAKFNDREAFEVIAKQVTQRQGTLEERQSGLRVLRQVRAPQLAEVALQLTDEPAMRVAGIAALGDVLDARLAESLMLSAKRWDSAADRRAAWYAMVGRPATASKLLEAISDQSLPANELSADMVQQILRLKDPDLVETVRKVWGNVRTTSDDRLKEAERIRKLIAQPKPEPDVEQGKRLYTKTCGQCHTLFGEGGKIGPELTGSNRRDLNYLLENILDPSAVMAREYQPIIVLTNEGQTITGLLRGENKESIRLQTATEEVTVYREDIEQMKQSELSMMPADLLSPLRDAEIRDLIAYLRSGGSAAATK